MRPSPLLHALALCILLTSCAAPAIKPTESPSATPAPSPTPIPTPTALPLPTPAPVDGIVFTRQPDGSLVAQDSQAGLEALFPATFIIIPGKQAAEDADVAIVLAQAGLGADSLRVAGFDPSAQMAGGVRPAFYVGQSNDPLLYFLPLTLILDEITRQITANGGQVSTAEIQTNARGTQIARIQSRFDSPDAGTVYQSVALIQTRLSMVAVLGIAPQGSQETMQAHFDAIFASLALFP